MEFYTYLHCRPDGTPFYVGKGFGKRSHRFSQGRTAHYKNVIAKYGKENIGVFVFPCESEKQALEDEVATIAQLRREGYALVNLTNGGEGASGRTQSASTREKVSAARKGKPNGRLGKTLSAETRAKQSAARMGWSPSEESRRKMSIAKLNMTPETKGKLSAARIRQGSPATGIKWTPESRAKMLGNRNGLRKRLPAGAQPGQTPTGGTTG